MADTIVATYGPPHQSFHYCGDVVATDDGLGFIADFDVVKFWVEDGDSVDVTVVGWCDDGSPSDQFVWVSEPGGTHITHFGDHTDEGHATYTAVDSDWDQVRIGMHGFGQVMHYCYTVIVNGMPIPADHLAVEAPPTAELGGLFDFTVTALDYADDTDTAYAGTVHPTSTEGTADLPADAGLTSGTDTFSATLNDAGLWTITATDTVDETITGTSEPIAVLGPDGVYDGWWGLAHSGRDTFWAARTDLSGLADEFTFDGDLVQTVQLAYPARHAWLGPEA